MPRGLPGSSASPYRTPRTPSAPAEVDQHPDLSPGSATSTQGDEAGESGTVAITVLVGKKQGSRCTGVLARVARCASLVRLCFPGRFVCESSQLQWCICSVHSCRPTLGQTARWWLFQQRHEDWSCPADCEGAARAGVQTRRLAEAEAAAQAARAHVAALTRLNSDLNRSLAAREAGNAAVAALQVGSQSCCSARGGCHATASLCLLTGRHPHSVSRHAAPSKS